MAQNLSELINGDKPVLVDFSAEWCGPCKLMPPILKELKQMVGENVTVIKLDIDKNPRVAAMFQVQSVPTMILFRKGTIQWRRSGVTSARDLKAAIDSSVS